MEAIPHSESTVFFFLLFLKASDILSWLFGETPQCRKHLGKDSVIREKSENRECLLTCARRNAVMLRGQFTRGHLLPMRWYGSVS